MAANKSKHENTFVVSWDCYGLEGCVDITQDLIAAEEHEKYALFDILADRETTNEAMRSISHTISSMQLRARFNTQRHYEIYLIHTAGGITETELRKMFEDAPQASAELIRDRGTKIYSDRVTPSNAARIKIT